MPLNASRLLNAIVTNSGGFLPAFVLVWAVLLVGMHAQAQAPPAKLPGTAQRAARQSAQPNTGPHSTMRGPRGSYNNHA